MDEKKPTILVVDDSDITRDTLQGCFSRLGCEVVCIESGEGAWMLLNTGRKIDLVILDWHMPNGMSGPALNRKIMIDPRYKDIPVVAFTSKWDPDFQTFESKEWVASFMGSRGGVLKMRGNYEVGKLDGNSEARRVPPELVVNVAERLKETGWALPEALEKVVLSLKPSHKFAA